MFSHACPGRGRSPTLVRTLVVALTGAALLGSGAGSVGAQRVGAPQLPDSAAVVTPTPPAGPLLRRGEVARAGAALVVAAALLPFDERITAAFRASGPQGSTLLRDAARGFDALGGPGSVALGAGAYVLGRLTERPHVAALGLHALEAVAAGEAVTVTLKTVVGRQRPYVDHADADDVAPGRGLLHGERASFPSGHTTAAFALATAATIETHRWWPHATRVVAPVAYGAAGLVGLARVYGAEHWASDVVAGATVGSLAGVAAERYVRARPRNRVERWLGVSVVPRVAPAGRALALVWSAGR